MKIDTSSDCSVYSKAPTNLHIPARLHKGVAEAEGRAELRSG